MQNPACSAGLVARSDVAAIDCDNEPLQKKNRWELISINTQIADLDSSYAMKDADVRKALHDLLREHHEDDDTRVVDEMGVWAGTVRIDVAVLNGETCGFEIKSDADTLDRLPYQAEIYEKVFDKITLVVGKRHAKKSNEIVPKWWGVIVATDDGDGVRLKEKRRPKRNKNIDPEILIQLLWKDEAISLLAELGHPRGWKAKRMRDIRAKILEEVTVQELAAHVRQIVKRRDNWLGQLQSNQLNMPVHS